MKLGRRRNKADAGTSQSAHDSYCGPDKKLGERVAHKETEYLCVKRRVRKSLISLLRLFWGTRNIQWEQ